MNACAVNGLECIKCNPGPCESRVDTTNPDGKGLDGTGRVIIPFNTKIRYRTFDRRLVNCFCGYYDKDNDTYNVFRGWDVHGVPAKDIEVFNWI